MYQTLKSKNKHVPVEDRASFLPDCVAFWFDIFLVYLI